MSEFSDYLLPASYKILVKAGLNPDWVTWFDGFEIQKTAEGNSFLVGRVEDQAALFGLINKICNLGLTLISLNRLEEPE
ncbi:MAG: hypothetical protein CVU39_22165 [Chloroflexi bacterium HGW-Chloroflexi-10]|nr:MAG: hypothetical protein CVU39_22165 [Chloroflexi bacterium HGW-Chloroflexi-10]